MGSLVQVPFHGRAVRGWVLGPTDDVPPRMLRVRRVVSPVRFFDEPMLAAVAVDVGAVRLAARGRDRPGRPAAGRRRGGRGRAGARHPRRRSPAARGRRIALRERAGTAGGARRAVPGPSCYGPAPGDDAALAVAMRRATRSRAVGPPSSSSPRSIRSRDGLVAGGGVRAGRRLVLRRRQASAVPDVAGHRRRPVPRRGRHAAGGVRAGPRGSDSCTWRASSTPCTARSGRPYFHARDVAVARARIEGARRGPRLRDALARGAGGRRTSSVAPAGRAWPPVEVVRSPGPRAGRPGSSARCARRVARSSTSRCAGTASRGSAGRARNRRRALPAAGRSAPRAAQIRCVVCEAPGRCAQLRRDRLRRRPRRRRARRGVGPLRRAGPGDAASGRATGRGRRREGEVLVGGLDAVKDVGPLGPGPRRDPRSRRGALARPGDRGPGARALGAWAEAASWARPGRPRDRADGASERPRRSRRSSTGRPERFAPAELPRLADAGFPVGAPVFRVAGTDGARGSSSSGSRTARCSSRSAEGATVCLVALRAGATCRRSGTRCARSPCAGSSTRVEAEPHL